jgi:hypothetical protein
VYRIGIWTQSRQTKTQQKEKSTEKNFALGKATFSLRSAGEFFSSWEVLPRGLRIKRTSTFFGVSAITSVAKLHHARE